MVKPCDSLFLFILTAEGQYKFIVLAAGWSEEKMSPVVC